jgi:hypothetical protein
MEINVVEGETTKLPHAMTARKTALRFPRTRKSAETHHQTVVSREVARHFALC